jgi:hypothetical protein
MRNFISLVSVVVFALTLTISAQTTTPPKTCLAKTITFPKAPAGVTCYNMVNYDAFKDFVLKSNQQYTQKVIAIAEKYAKNEIEKSMLKDLQNFFSDPSDLDYLFQEGVNMVRLSYGQDSTPLIDYVMCWYQSNNNNNSNPAFNVEPKKTTKIATLKDTIEQNSKRPDFLGEKTFHMNYKNGKQLETAYAIVYEKEKKERELLDKLQRTGLSSGYGKKFGD